MRSLAHLTPRLNILGKQEEKVDLDDILEPNPDPSEADLEYSRQIIASLPLSSKLHRDLAIDYMNPREELAKFVQTEDQIPAFDFTTLGFLAPYDDEAKQQIGLVQEAAKNWAVEEGKYNPQATSGKEPPGKSEPGYFTEAEWTKMLMANLDMQHQTALDQTSSL